MFTGNRPMRASKGKTAMNCRILPGGVLSLALVTPVFAGTVFEFETSEFDGPEPILGTVQMSTAGSNTRLEIISVSSNEAGGLIFHGDSKELIILDHLQGTYIVIDQNLMNATTGQADPEIPETQEDPAQMSPEERATAEQGAERQIPAPQQDQIKSLGSRGEVAGVPCHNYEVLRGARKVREMCVSRWQDLAGGQETATALRGVVDFFEGLRQAFAGTSNMGDLDGYPVLYRDFEPSGRMVRETRLTAARQKDISPEFFSPPKTYVAEELLPDPN
jgi:hypothetical protein